MDFINIETKKIVSYEFTTFDTTAFEYFEEDPKFTYEFKRNPDSLDYTLTIVFSPVQKKQNQGATINVETVFTFTASDVITFPLNEETIRIVSDLLYVAWTYTTVLFNLLGYQSIFKDNYLSKHSIGLFYSNLKENHNPEK